MNLLRILSVGLLMIALSSNTNATTLSVATGDQTVFGALGQSLEVTIAIDGLSVSSVPSLSVYDISLVYDASILTYGGVVFDSSEMDFGLGSFTDSTPGTGTLNLLELSFESPVTLDTNQAAAFNLATITFYTASYGFSAIDFGAIVLGDSLGDPLSFETASGSVAVSAVPVPAAAWLFVSALSLLGWRRTSYKQH